MPTTTRPRSKAASAVATPASTARPMSHRAPFGFVFFFILLVATFAFSTFYVVSQTANEQAMRRESSQAIGELTARVNGLQTQVNTLSAQVSLQQAALERLSPSSTSTLPTSRPAQR